MSVRAKVELSEKAVKLLESLPGELHGTITPAALKEAGLVIVARAATLARRSDRRRKGKHLRDTIGVQIRKYARAVAAVVGPEYPAGAHGHLVEGGTRAHEVKTKNRRTLADGENVYGPTVRHPGAKPNPFLQPAVDQTAAAVDAAIERRVAEGLEAAAR